VSRGLLGIGRSIAIVAVTAVALIAIVGHGQWGPHGGPLVVLQGIDFGEVEVGESASEAYAFRNPYGERVTVNALGFGDSFSSRYPGWTAAPTQTVLEVVGADPVPATLRIGERFRFTVRFSPQAAQEYRLENLPDVLTMCVTTEASGQHIHFLIPITGTGTGEEAGGVFALVHAYAYGVLQIIDVVAGAMHAEVAVQHTVAKPLPIVVTPDGRFALLHSFTEGVLKIIDIAGGHLHADVDVPHSMAKPLPIAVTPDGRFALLHSFVGGGLKIIDIERGALHADVGVPHSMAKPLPIAVTPDGRFALLHSFYERVLKIIDIASGHLHADVAVPGPGILKPLPIAVTADSRFALLHSFAGGVLKIIDIERGELHADVAVGGQAFAVPLLVSAAPAASWVQGITDPVVADAWYWAWEW